MIALIAYWLAQHVGTRAARPLAWVIVIVAAGLLAWGCISIWTATHDAKVIQNHEAKTSAKLERTGRQADASAAQRAEARRRAEAIARKDFDNATAGIPDSGLSDRQRVDLCRELHDAGVAASRIPECRDVRPGGEARP